MKNYIILFLIICFVVALFLYSQEKKKNENQIFIDKPLPENVSGQIVVEKTQIKTKAKVITSSGTITQAQILPTYPESQVVINITDDNQIKILDRDIKGFRFRPALSLGYDNNANIGICARFFFYRNFGAFAGLYYGLNDREANALAGVDYRLSLIGAPNVSVFCGYNSKSKIVLGFNFYFN
jgi:hypothetical protein